MSLMKHNWLVLQITGYLEALELDKETRDSIKELCKTNRIDNLTICLEMLKTLSKSEKQRI